MKKWLIYFSIEKLSSRVCITWLLLFQENAMFLVDTSTLIDKKCVLCDDLGTWSNSGYSRSAFTIENRKLIDSYSLPRSLKNCSALKW